jgi:6-pyruvoyltetrahydropterin/6-carboxytetrahydropterin synthase
VGVLKGDQLYTLTKKVKFEAAHSLMSWTHSKCHNIHGHSWELEATLAAGTLDNNAIVDLELMGKYLHDLIFSKVDHQYLNDSLREKDPTCEFIARWAWTQLKPVMPHLTSVRVQETSSGWATYSEATANEEGSHSR